LYVDHLREYDSNPNKTKMGHIPIRNMTEAELKNTLQKIVYQYK